MHDFEDIITHIKKIKDKERTLLIAIDGFGGSGKTFLAKSIAYNLPQARIIEMDDFYSSKLQKPDIERLYKQVIKPLKNNQTSNYQIYDWKNDCFIEAKPILPGSTVIIEGVFSLAQKLSDNYDVKIWVECPPEVGLERGITRDGEEVREKWTNIWMPMEKEYVKNQNPRIRADYIINTGEVSK